MAAILEHIAIDLDYLIARFDIHAGQYAIGIDSGHKAGHLLSILVPGQRNAQRHVALSLHLDTSQIFHHVISLIDLGHRVAELILLLLVPIFFLLVQLAIASRCTIDLRGREIS